jgi:hypothetical protein
LEYFQVHCACGVRVTGARSIAENNDSERQYFFVERVALDVVSKHQRSPLGIRFELSIEAVAKLAVKILDREVQLRGQASLVTPTFSSLTWQRQSAGPVIVQQRRPYHRNGDGTVLSSL